MTELIHIGAAMANQAGAIPCTARRAAPCTISGTMLRLISAFRAAWPHKPAAELQARTGRSERMCKYWLARRYEISVDDLANLLRSDDGLAFLEAVMGDARPGWWKAFKRQMRLVETSRRVNELKRELDRLNQQDD